MKDMEHDEVDQEEKLKKSSKGMMICRRGEFYGVRLIVPPMALVFEISSIYYGNGLPTGHSICQ